MGRRRGKNTERLGAAERREQILDAAEKLLIEVGHLPLRLDRLSRHAGISRALVYARFPTQHHLANAILQRQFQALVRDGIEKAAALPGLIAAAANCGDIYYRHVASHGPIIAIIMRDQYAAEHLDPAVVRVRDAVFQQLAETARRELTLDESEDRALFDMVLAIPEEAGRLVFEGRLDAKRGRDLCVRLIKAGIDALRPASGK